MQRSVIVTRPAKQAQRWVQSLQQAGYEAHSLPLIEIASADSPQDALLFEQTWQQGAGWQALMFVSSNAVEHFFRLKGQFAPVFIDSVAINNIANEVPSPRFWATGPGTVSALLAHGVAAQHMDAPTERAVSFDSEALWSVIQPQLEPGLQVLLIRGRDVGKPDSSRDWLAQRLLASGVVVKSLVVYERRAPHLSEEQQAQAQDWLRDGSVWLWSSSQALLHLPPACDASKAVCICTHERIAQAAKQRGFAVVLTSRPTVQDVLASIESLA